MSLSRRAQLFQDLLRERGIDLTVVELPDSTRTAAEAARTLGCELGQIVKSLVFRGTSPDEPILVLASGSNRVNEKAVSAAIGNSIGKADADYVKSTTGFAVGGVPPLGHKTPVTTVVDENLLDYPEVWAAAGTPFAVFRIPGKITEFLPAHRVMSIT